MSKFYREDTTLTTAKLSREWLWVENSIEHVDANCALPKYSVATLPPHFDEGFWPKWKPASQSWTLIRDHRFLPFYDASGKLYLPEEVETPYPDWAIFTKPPEHDSSKYEVLFIGGEWLVFKICLGLAYYNDDGFVGNAANYFELLPTETFDELPTEWVDGFTPTVIDSLWHFEKEGVVVTSAEMVALVEQHKEDLRFIAVTSDEEQKDKELLNEQVMRVMRKMAQTHLENEANLSKEDALTLQLIKAMDKKA